MFTLSVPFISGMDDLTKQQRSYCMSRIRSKDTTPEVLVRRLIHRLGFRFRLHVRQLPGCPDLVFASKRKVIFVHGCFWHKHRCRYGRVRPKTNPKYWEKKRAGNVVRHRKAVKMLRDLGWDVLVIWECQTRKPEKIIDKIIDFLEQD